jgi:hypothetical protein
MLRPSTVVVALFLLVGCTASPPKIERAPKTAPASTESSAHAEDLPTTPPPSPTWDQAAEGEATRVGFQAMVAYAQTGIDADTWYAQLAPYLTPDAQAAYKGTDPAEVPVHEVGLTWADTPDSAYLVYVSVNTDVGTYQLMLVRESADAGWLVQRIASPPTGVGD